MPKSDLWTHEELLLALAIAVRRNWKSGNSSTPEFLELSELLRAANFPGLTEPAPNFRSPSSVSRKVSNFIGANDRAAGGLHGGAREKALIERYYANPDAVLAAAAQIQHDATFSQKTQIPLADLLDEEIDSVPEGAVDYVLTIRRERSRGLRSSKIQSVKRAGEPIACLVCGFDFSVAYGELGNDFIEIHHRIPLHASGATTSALEDLVLLCANCHRMIHRNGWRTVESLADAWSHNPPDSLD